MGDLNGIKGIGQNTLAELNNLGIFSIMDLVTYFPFRYDIFERSNLTKLEDGDKVVIDGVIENVPSIYYFSRKLNKMSFRLNVGSSILKISIFNRAYLKKSLSAGIVVTVIGKYESKTNSVMAQNIKFGSLDKVEIVPIYHSSARLNSKKIHRLINQVLDKVDVIDYIPIGLCDKYRFIDKSKAIFLAHNPSSKSQLYSALRRLKYEELFLFMSKINYLKRGKNRENGLVRKVNIDDVNKKIAVLPFKLTSDQAKSVNTIFDDLTGVKRMNRLLQGDVGSGKTIVSFMALYINYLGGYQGALMAPTEILACQHFAKIVSLFPELNIYLLTGKTKAKEKREILDSLAAGNCDIIIGTHALISNDVIYKNLGLVVTDEQHRFGVGQRANLKNKGRVPDILYMSATPIPRTYALTLYGDMDISSIRTMPSGRKPVRTILKKEKDIKDVLYLMLDQIKLKHQVYVIAPLVEQSDKMDMKDVYELEDKMKRAFGRICKIGVLHGKMKPQEKENVMNRFKDNEIQILISTTVIEVGVDVANATMMVIFDSYRFGLSALHQLRGRVGRSDLDSYCILISDKQTKRLSILTKTNDGFKISEEDFLLRGSGDLFGLRQSGDMQFKIANLKRDYNMLLCAKKDSNRFINSELYNRDESTYIKSAIEISSLD